MFLFGIIVTLQGFGILLIILIISVAAHLYTVQDYSGLLALRAFLGLAEAGVYPGCKHSPIF